MTITIPYPCDLFTIGYQDAFDAWFFRNYAQAAIYTGTFTDESTWNSNVIWDPSNPDYPLKPSWGLIDSVHTTAMTLGTWFDFDDIRFGDEYICNLIETLQTQLADAEARLDALENP